MFVVEAADLKVIIPGNMFCKYADDIYIIIPASNSHTRTTVLEHIDSRAKDNNLTLNHAKTLEVIFADKKSKRTVTPPPPLPAWIRSFYYCLILYKLRSDTLILNEDDDDDDDDETSVKSKETEVDKKKIEDQ